MSLALRIDNRVIEIESAVEIIGYMREYVISRDEQVRARLIGHVRTIMVDADLVTKEEAYK